jgi:hypothetical protein
VPDTPSSSSRTASPKRSWISNQKAGTNRRTMLAFLGFLIVTLLLVFGWFIWQGETPRIYAVRINVPNYPEEIPNIEKNSLWRWDREWIDHCTSKGLIPWKELGEAQSEGVATKNKILELINIGEKIQQEGSKSQDVSCVVVQLRCHATVTRRNGADTILELLVKDNSNQDDALYFEELAKELIKIPASNILVLADICDLQYLPAKQYPPEKQPEELSDTGPEGWIFPSIAEKLKESLKLPNSTTNRNLFVLCCAADGQIPLMNRRSESLFQKACLDCLDLKEKSDPSVFLAEYYRSIVGYVHRESRKQQTPLLFWASKEGGLLCNPKGNPGEQKGWQLASAAQICMRDKRAPGIKPPPGDQSSDTPDSNASAATTEKSITKNQNTAEAPTSTNETDLWEFVDSVRQLPEKDPASTGQTSELNWRWRPYEYAPSAWRQVLGDLAIESSRQWENNVNESTTVSGAKKDLRALASFSNSPVQKGTLSIDDSKRFGQGWKAFESNPAKAFWENPSKLPANESKAWTRSRESIRTYSDALMDVIGWRDATMVMPDPKTLRALERSSVNVKTELENHLMELLEKLENIRVQLPASPGDNFISKATADGSQTLETLAAEIIEKRKDLSHQIDEITDAVQKENVADWRWFDEFLCCNLLQSPVLNNPQRKKLREIVAERKIKKESTTSPTDGELEEIITTALLRWKNTREKRRELSEKIENKLRGLQYLQEADKENPLSQWHGLALAPFAQTKQDVTTAESSRESSGIVFYPGDKRGVRILLSEVGDGNGNSRAGSLTYLDFADADPTDNSHLLKRDFYLEVIPILEETKDSELEISWHIPSGENDEKMTLIASGKAWEKTKSLPSKPNDKIRITIEWDPDARMGKDKRTPSVEFVAKDKSRVDSKTLGVGSFPLYRNASRIDVIAKSTVETGAEIFPVDSALEGVKETSLTLGSPAIKDVYGAFQFHLRNQLPTERSAQVKLSWLPDGEKPFAESKRLKLPAARIGNNGNVSSEVTNAIAFMPIPDPDVDVANAHQPSTIYCIVDEYETDGKDSEIPTANGVDKATVGTKPEKPKPVKSYKFEIRLKAIPPNDFIELTHERRNLEFGGQCDFALDYAKLINYDVEKILVKAEWVDLTADKPTPMSDEVEVALEKNKQKTKIPLNFKKFPTITDNNDLKVSFSVGTYPRSHFFRLRGKPPVSFEKEFTRPVVPGNVKIEPIFTNVREDQRNDAAPFKQSDESRWIFKNYIYSKENNKPTKLNYDSIRLSCESETYFDAAENHQIPWELLEVRDRSEKNSKPKDKGSWSDRHAVPSFTWNDNKMEWKLGFEVKELEGKISLQPLFKQDSEEWELRIGDTGHSKAWTLVFDRKPPNADGDVETVDPDTTFYEEEETSIRIETQDTGGSGLDDWVLVTLKKDERSIVTDFRLDAPWRDSNSVEVVLWSKDKPELKQKLKSLGKDADNIEVSVTTLDRAGNAQSKNKPLEFSWKAGQKP